MFFKNELRNVPTLHVLNTFLNGLSLNFSASAYLSVLSISIYFSSVFIQKSKTLQNINTFYLIVALIICTLIYTVDFSLYQSWGTKINGKALWYLQFSDSTNTVKGDWGFVKYFLVLFTVSLIFGYVFFKKLKNFKPIKAKFVKLFPVYFIVLLLLFYALRGGLTGRPIDKGNSFYSKYSSLNYAAVNGFWNFFDIVSNLKKPSKPYNFFNETELENFKNFFNQKKSDSLNFKLSNIQKPNIIFIFLESWSADVVGCLGGESGITPCFDKLKNEGILFKNFYSTGFRTEQGLMASLSGFPAQAQTYPMLDFDRFDNYPNIIKSLSKIGYFTSYFTGGNPHFANTDVYLISAGIDKINKDLLGRAKKRSAWGAYDQESFEYLLNGLSKQHQPFFSTMVTITSHEWFEADVPQIFKDKDPVAARYKNTVHYTDSCLYDFITKSKKYNWFKNSLIFIMADHACSYPLHHNFNNPKRYHIPFLITGGALKPQFKNTINNAFGGHLTIPSILCNEVNLDDSVFMFSKNMITDSLNSFSYFTYDHGFGLMQGSGAVVWDQNLKKLIYSNGNKEKNKTLLKTGKFILQYSAKLKDEYQIKK
ncbi:MAG: sulfatase-like hydrolase/transferase [Bacteroidetes bacterium]|nr:sulfatase-like hydrolase/transferase [Bacteroidota bacterium]